jgi:hypothetical protein
MGAATLAGIVPVLLLGWSAYGIDGFASSSLALYVLVAAVFAPFGWWAAQTWQLLWRQGHTRWERLVFNSGVRGNGMIMTIATVTGLGCLAAASGDGTADSLRRLVGGVFFGIVFGLPVCLHLGYFIAVTFAKITGVERP